MTAEFIHRHNKRLSDRNVQTIVAEELARHGYVVDRLRDVDAAPYGPACWRYVIPIRQVTA
jgi:hypothetical protein